MTQQALNAGNHESPKKITWKVQGAFSRYRFMNRMKQDLLDQSIPFRQRIEKALHGASELLGPCRTELVIFTGDESDQALQDLDLARIDAARGCRFLQRGSISSTALLLSRRRSLCISPFESGFTSKELARIIGDSIVQPAFLAGVRFRSDVLGFIVVRPLQEGKAWTRSEQSLAETVAEIFSQAFEDREKEVLRHRCSRWETLHRISFENAGSAMFIFDQDKVIQDVNGEFLALSGYERADLVHKTWPFLIHGEDLQSVVRNHEARNQEREAPHKYEFRLVTRVGEVKHVSATITMVPGTGERLAAFIDLTLLKQAQHEVSFLSKYDAVTGVRNRAMFMDRLEQAASWCARGKERGFALLFLDIRRFKWVNDALGSATGDSILREYAGRIKESVFTIDTVARFGGDQFLVLLRDVHSVEQVVKSLRRILQSVGSPFRRNKTSVTLDTRIGVVLSQGNEKLDTSQTVQNAINAMEQAKQKEVEYTFFEEGMQQKDLERLTLEMELRRAIEKEEIELFFQPLYSLAQGSIIGFEALARWNHPVRCWVPPLQFIELAEQTGLIISLGNLLLRKACTQLRRWEEEFPAAPPRVAVNISGKQLLHPEFVPMLQACIAETGCNPGLLSLEITESSLIRELDQIDPILEALKSMGIRFSLDDFGTGYSSLAYLQRISPNTIKLDRSFVSNGGGDRIANEEIVKAVLTLAKSMRITVVAEGIETEQQLQSLAAWGSDVGQGFFLSRPLPGADAGRLLRNEQAEG